jgi:hypothetical protein
MKRFLLIGLTICLFVVRCLGQEEINDKSFRYQEERMVFKQWDQDKFTPTKGFLGLNPYYWLTWGWFYPNYHKTDLRPLSPAGPQTQRLALAAAMNTIDGKYKLQSDTVKNTALLEIANQSGLVSGADPLWVLYYSDQLGPVLNNSSVSVLAGLSAQLSTKLVSEGTYSWYKHELDMLKERVEAAHSADMDRGARILAYHRLLMEYRRLAGVWSTRICAAQSAISMTARQQKVKNNQVSLTNWTPQTDVQIANHILQHIQ